MKLPLYVNWETTNACNMGCPYCFLAEHPEGIINQLQTKDAKKLIDILAENGVKLLNYAGGEPFLRKDLPELLGYGKSFGLKTVISTNGILLDKEIIKQVMPNLNWISLPIDGYDEKTHDSVRGMDGHFKHVTGLLGLLQDEKVNIKINTMLCRKNVKYVGKIEELLQEYEIKKWKLFQFSARGKARKIADEYSISEAEFLQSKNQLRDNCSFDAVYSSNALRDNAYFLIAANGNVTIPSGEQYLNLGSILNKDFEISCLDFEKNLANAKISYNLEVKL